LLKCGNEWDYDDGEWGSLTLTLDTQITLGAYYGAETECTAGDECTDNASVNPIIDQNDTTFVWDAPGYNGIYSKGVSGIIINDIKIQNVGRTAIKILDGDGGSINRVTTFNTWGAGIWLGDSWAAAGHDVDGWVVDSCDISQHNMAWGINVIGSFVEGWGNAVKLEGIHDSTISNNQVYQGHGEGIVPRGAYAHDLTIERNILWDNSSSSIHVHGYNNIIRYNYVFFTSDNTYADMYTIGLKGWGISIHDEANDAGDLVDPYNNAIYSNLIAGCSSGFHVGEGLDDGDESPSTNYFIGNTLIDNHQNFTLGTGKDEILVLFRNNLSVINDSGNSNHTGTETMTGTNYTWSGNGWDDEESPGATYYANGSTCAAPDVCGDPALVTATSWYDQAAYFVGDGVAHHGSLTASSDFIDTAATLTAYWATGLNAPSVWPAAVLTLLQGDHGAGWDFGAFVSQEEQDNPPIMTHYSKFDLGALLRDEITDNDAYWTDNDTVQQSATSKQGDRSAFFDEDNAEYLTRSGTVDDFELGTSGKLTICFWVMPLDLTTQNIVFNKGAIANEKGALKVTIEADDTLSVGIGYGALSDAFETHDHNNALTVDQWYYVCWAHAVSYTHLTLPTILLV